LTKSTRAQTFTPRIFKRAGTMPYYLVISGEENWAYSVELEDGKSVRIGRAQDNDVVLKDRRVSSYHARINTDGGVFALADLESRNGTYVNDARVRKATLKSGDQVRLGQVTIQFTEKLDPTALSGAAILSPRLSQPLLKTEMQKLRDLIDDFTLLQDRMARGLVTEQEMPNVAQSLGKSIDKLHEVELHMRTLISTNHFHELFHQPRPLRELFTDALRFVAAALEAENAALVVADGTAGSNIEPSLTVQATMGLSVAAWPGGIPARFEALLRECLREGKPILIRNLGQDQRFASFAGMDMSSDKRSLIMVPLRSVRGRAIGVGYFDNPSKPEKLNASAAKLAEGCFHILADHLTGEVDAGGGTPQPQRRDETADFDLRDDGSKTLLSLD
jgi:hypothetical protein